MTAEAASHRASSVGPDAASLRQTLSQRQVVARRRRPRRAVVFVLFSACRSQSALMAPAAVAEVG